MSTTILTRPCSEVPEAAIQWLWRPYLARGKLAVLDGEPGAGKSLVATDIAARLSRGDALPDGQRPGRPHVTLVLSAEGEPSDTVRPRLVAAGADLTKVIVAGTGGVAPLPQLPGCAEAISRAVYEHAADLVVIDPLSAFLPREYTAGPQRVREGLAPLAEVALETGCAVLLVRHLPRGARAAGEALLAVARTAMLAARHPEEPGLRVLAVSKSHLGPPPPALGFRLADRGAGSAVEWCGVADVTPEEARAPRYAEWARRPRERAAEFLLAALAAGPVAVGELEKLAAAKGMAWRTVERARRQLNVVAQQAKKGCEPGWYWRLLSLHDDGDALRCATLRALFQLPKKIKQMHELRDEGDAMDDARDEARERRAREAREAREAPPG